MKIYIRSSSLSDWKEWYEKKYNAVEVRIKDIINRGLDPRDDNYYDDLAYLFMQQMEDLAYRLTDSGKVEYEKYEILSRMADDARKALDESEDDSTISDAEYRQMEREVRKDELRASEQLQRYEDGVKKFVLSTMKDPSMLDLLNSEYPNWRNVILV